MVLHLTSCICLGPVTPAFIPPSIAAKGTNGDFSSRVLEIIRKHGSIYLNSLTKKTQWIKQPKRDAILVALTEAGQIRVEHGKPDGAGRPSRRYSVI